MINCKLNWNITVLRLVLKLRPGYVSLLQKGQQELAPLLPLGVSDPRIILAINSDAPARIPLLQLVDQGRSAVVGSSPSLPR